jgi:hypothetical protein
MTPTEFVDWMRGFMDAATSEEYALSVSEIEILLDKLATVQKPVVATTVNSQAFPYTGLPPFVTNGISC